MTEIRNNPDRMRYEALIDGAVAGFAEYLLTDELIVFTRTEVQPAYDGQGAGSALARFALDEVRRNASRRVLPTCPFIKEWIRRHPEYGDLLYGVPATTVKD